MKIEILDIDKLIAVNKLEEVTSPRLFAVNMTFDPNGILSQDIFGLSKNDRRNTFAYITLNRKFIHPHIYDRVLKRSFRNIMYLLSGQRRFKINDVGLLTEDPNGWTGIDSLYEHWDEIKWEKLKSTDQINKSVLINLTKEMVFIDKLLIIPPAYRDVLLAGTVDNSDHVAELNKIYTKIMRSVSSLQQGGLFARTQYATQFKVQTMLVELLDYFKNQLSGKNGLIRKFLFGKSVDYGVRAVISAPTYNHNRFEDNIIDLDHSAIPISQCCSLYKPFIEAWLKNFFTREIINDPNVLLYYDETNKRYVTLPVADPEVQFSDKNITKFIDDYMMNPDNRFKKIQILLKDDREKEKIKTVSLYLKGKIITENNVQKQLQRPMTITDILFLACVDVCEKRHVMISRYPVGTDKGIIFTKIRVRSTVKTINIIFNNKEYKFYPDIDININHDKVGVQFIDTLVISNSHLDGMGKHIVTAHVKLP